ncbi:MAG: RDD family protein [Chloroflexi bacterium]|nr:RDD family protein [Chloroflexota bacterium]
MASDSYQVLTPERVSLQYDIAGIGSRGAAALVDTVIQTLALMAAGLLAAGILAVTNGAVTPAIVVGVVALALVTLGYFVFFEIVWSGQTPGKRLLGVRVIRESGYPIRPADAVIRNLVRIVDGLPAMYALGVLTMLFNARSKRLGDFAAGTIVVREGVRAPRLIFARGGVRAPGLTTPAARADSAPAAVLLQPADATLVRDFLLRRSSMNESARAQLAQRIAAAMAQRYGLPLTTDAESFLESLI